MRRLVPGIAFVAAATLSLTACSGSDEEPAADPTTASDSPTTGGDDTISPPDLPVPPQLRDAEGALADIEWDPESCEVGAGEQTVEGTVTNSSDDRLGFVVQISWSNDSYDVRGQGFDVVRGLRPGDSADWSVTAEVSDGATSCVPNVQRGLVRD